MAGTWRIYYKIGTQQGSVSNIPGASDSLDANGNLYTPATVPYKGVQAIIYEHPVHYSEIASRNNFYYYHTESQTWIGCDADTIWQWAEVNGYGRITLGESSQTWDVYKDGSWVTHTTRETWNKQMGELGRFKTGAMLTNQEWEYIYNVVYHDEDFPKPTGYYPATNRPSFNLTPPPESFG